MKGIFKLKNYEQLPLVRVLGLVYIGAMSYSIITTVLHPWMLIVYASLSLMGLGIFRTKSWRALLLAIPSSWGIGNLNWLFRDQEIPKIFDDQIIYWGTWLVVTLVAIWILTPVNLTASSSE